MLGFPMHVAATVANSLQAPPSLVGYWPGSSITSGLPFTWDKDRRSQLRADLDAW